MCLYMCVSVGVSKCVFVCLYMCVSSRGGGVSSMLPVTYRLTPMFIYSIIYYRCLSILQDAIVTYLPVVERRDFAVNYQLIIGQRKMSLSLDTL